MKDIKSIEKAVSKFIEVYDLLDKDKTVAVALSGGADSVCMLTMLTRLGYKCDAIHCNFHLRGKESMRDEEFVTNLCSKMGVKLYKGDFDTGVYASSMGISIEIAAREQRYNFFKQILEESGDQAIAVAHHKDDNVETLMLNLIRGTGIRGIRGMLPKSGKVVRPFLCISSEDVQYYLEKLGQDYVTDSTNLSNVFSRNKIRNEVMPILNTINTAASSNMALSMEHLREVCKIYEDAIQMHINNCSKKDGDNIIIDINKLEATPSPRSVLHEIVNGLGFNKTQEVNMINALSEQGKTFSTPKWQLLIDRGNIIIQPKSNDSEENDMMLDIKGSSGEYTIKDLGVLKYKVYFIDDLRLNKDRHCAYFDVDKLQLPLMIRTVKRGDFFAPFGLKGDIKLVSDFLTDRKLSLFQKMKQKVITSGDNIAWIVGERSSELYRIGDDTNRVLELRIE